jgi:mono/diheme cytochrome c family protein
MNLRTAAMLLAIAVGLAFGPALAGSDGQDFSQIERGRYLAIASDCVGCHTNDGGPAFAGGRSVETPFGTILATNITPDRATGIGDWNDDDFVRALTLGIRRDGAHLYPAMPYPYFTKMTRDDVLAIRAYLSTVPAVRNKVNADQLPFPLSVRADMAAWNKLYLTPGAFQPLAGKSSVWNRGAYLVQGPMHCGACHTPKNIAGADDADRQFQGYALQGWFAPDITSDKRRGLGAWSIDDIVAYLETGHNRFAAASGPMAEEVQNSSSKMSEADLRAVATYLKDQPAPKEDASKPPPSSGPAVRIGSKIYADECSACHTPRGDGVAGLIPALAASPSVQSIDPSSLIRVVLNGAQSVATDKAPTAPAMPAFGWILDDRQTADVLTYIRNAWGNIADPVTADQVAKQRSSLAKRSD